MPEVQNDITRQKLSEVRRRTVRAAKLWLDLHQACSNGDVEAARGLWKSIRDVSVEASDMLKSIDNG